MSRFKFEKKIFAAYLTAGDGDSEAIALALLRSGVDLLEIGIPYTDPIADGPVIQEAMQRSLQRGADLEGALDLLSRLRGQTEAPLILFTYFNPIARDLFRFLSRAKEAGADGVLVVDLPYEESEEFRFLCDRMELAPIFVIAPSTSEERIRRLSHAARGFLYYACRKGTTGEKQGIAPDALEKLRLIKRHASVPVIAGFGIASKGDAQTIIKEADGFVIGSAFVRAIGQGSSIQQLERMCHDFRP